MLDHEEMILVHVIAEKEFGKTACRLEEAAQHISTILDGSRTLVLQVASGWRK
jgi:hypothetical protein